jgi:hypothetical protein
MPKRNLEGFDERAAVWEIEAALARVLRSFDPTSAQKIARFLAQPVFNAVHDTFWAGHKAAARGKDAPAALTEGVVSALAALDKSGGPGRAHIARGESRGHGE